MTRAVDSPTDCLDQVTRDAVAAYVEARVAEIVAHRGGPDEPWTGAQVDALARILASEIRSGETS